MPKKKLTKTQVSKAYESIFVTLSKLRIDKISHMDSNVTMSEKMLGDLSLKIIRARKP